MMIISTGHASARRRLLMLFALGNLADYLLTVCVFPQVGITEANGLVAPLLALPFAWPLLAGKLLLTLGLVLWSRASVHVAPEVVRLVLWGVVLLMAGIVGWNVVDVARALLFALG